MKRKEAKAINRRKFLWSSTVAVVAGKFFGFIPSPLYAGPSVPPTADTIELMKAATAGIRELNTSFTKWAEEVEKAKAMMEKQKDIAGVMAVLQIVTGIIMIIIAVVVSVVSFGAGGTLVMSAAVATARLNGALVELANKERDIGSALMGASIGAAIANVRQIVGDVKDAVVARDILYRISQDRVYASRLFELLSSGKRSAAEELLKGVAADSTVTVQAATVASALNISLRINNFNYCLSSATACSGKQLTFRR